MDYSGLCVWRVSGSLPAKTSFIDFEKDRGVVVATEYYIFRIFLVAVNSRYTIVPFSPRFGIKFRY